MPNDLVNGHRDLWGAEFEPIRGDSVPIVLLKQQADALTRRTNGLMEGVVLDEIHEGTAWFTLYARVPALHGYMQKF